MIAKTKKNNFEPVPTSRQGDKVLRRRKRSRKGLRSVARAFRRLFKGSSGE